jgi:GSH-dependent disulfide-bond oxidoreductase
MIDVYYWTTPNGHKIIIFLEEAQLEYRIIPVNITRSEQFQEEFIKVSPNNKIPAIVDDYPSDNNGPYALFESGAILQYLAEEAGSFLPKDLRGRFETLKWLTWQVANLGPMSGQNHYFSRYANEIVPHAKERYQKITAHLYSVLDKQLRGKEFIIGDEYTIADMAVYPWVVSDVKDAIDLNDFPDIRRWYELIAQRPAVIRAYEKADVINEEYSIDDQGKKALFAV